MLEKVQFQQLFVIPKSADWDAAGLAKMAGILRISTIAILSAYFCRVCAG